MFSPVQERNNLSCTGEILLPQNPYETFLSRTGERASPSQNSHRPFLSRPGKMLLSFLSFFPVRERTCCFPPSQEKVSRTGKTCFLSPVRERVRTSLWAGDRWGEVLSRTGKNCFSFPVQERGVPSRIGESVSGWGVMEHRWEGGWKAPHVEPAAHCLRIEQRCRRPPLWPQNAPQR